MWVDACILNSVDRQQTNHHTYQQNITSLLLNFATNYLFLFQCFALLIQISQPLSFFLLHLCPPISEIPTTCRCHHTHWGNKQSSRTSTKYNTKTGGNGSQPNIENLRFGKDQPEVRYFGCWVQKIPELLLYCLQILREGFCPILQRHKILLRLDLVINTKIFLKSSYFLIHCFDCHNLTHE